VPYQKDGVVGEKGCVVKAVGSTAMARVVVVSLIKTGLDASAQAIPCALPMTSSATQNRITC
jgi:hypothetical protein